MKNVIMLMAALIGFTTTAVARDPGLPSGVTCTCEALQSPLLYNLVVNIPGGYPSSVQTYGPYTIEQCTQAMNMLPISRYCNL
jgi:hypothetical protein